jgi:hypothetical protein
MSDIPSFPYRLLWGERCVRSVANLTRRDGEEFLALAPRVPVYTDVQTFPLTQANEALTCLREGRIRGAAVLIPDNTAPRSYLPGWAYPTGRSSRDGRTSQQEKYELLE